MPGEYMKEADTIEREKASMPKCRTICHCVATPATEKLERSYLRTRALHTAMSYRQSSYTRYNTFHTPKQQVLGNNAGHAAPAWRVAGSSGANASIGKGKQAASQAGSKILLSRLPVDVSEKEVEVSASRYLTDTLLNKNPFFRRELFTGIVQEDRRAIEGFFHRVQLARKIQRDGNNILSETW